MHGINRIGLVTALLIGLGSSVGSIAQTVYKSVDEQGIVSFTDRPPLQQDVDDSPLDVMPLQIRLTNPAAIAANRESAAADKRARDLVDAAAGDNAEDEAAEAARKADERAANCDLAQQRLSRYATANRLYKEGDTGERVYLNDQEIDAERLKAARAVDEWCGN